MVSSFRIWWNKIDKPLKGLIISLLVVSAGLLVVILLGYIFNWGWTGLSGNNNISVATEITPMPQKIIGTIAYPVGKTLWDWLQLLIIPVVLAFGGYFFNLATTRNEDKIALDTQNELALQTYLDKMSELLLKEELSSSLPEIQSQGIVDNAIMAKARKIANVRMIARARTITVLPRLDAIRKGSVLQFLYESSLINNDGPIIDLSGANLDHAKMQEAILDKAGLRGAKLNQAFFYEASLKEVNLSDAELVGANMVRANLCGANLNANLYLAVLSNANLHKADLSMAMLEQTDLSGANLSGANLSKADLSTTILEQTNLKGANLEDAVILEEQLNLLDQAGLLQGTIMPNGSTHS